MRILLPVFKPRWYQVFAWMAVQFGMRKHVWLSSRRYGKDLTVLNILACEMMKKTISVIYFLPTRKLASDIVWNGATNEGVPYLSVFPKQIVKHKNNKDMIITLINGSKIQFYGSDFTENVGMNANIVVFSEFFICKFSAFQLVIPIITMNKGMLIMFGTIRNKNHQFKLFKRACHEGGFYVQDMDLRDTKQIPLEDVQRSIDVGEIEYDVAMREFFNVVLDTQEQQATYLVQYTIMKMEKRIGDHVKLRPHLPQFCMIDFGLDDCTAISYFQWISEEVNIHDYDEENNQPVKYYGKLIREKYPKLKVIFTVWDANRRGMVSGETPREIFEAMGFVVIPVKRDKLVSIGVARTREEFSKFCINSGCIDLTNSVKKYNYLDTSKKAHVWSHGCDTLRGISRLIKIGMLDTMNDRYMTSADSEQSAFDAWLNHNPQESNSHDIGGIDNYSNELGF